MENLFFQLKLFFHRSERNSWISNNNIKIYLRKSKRYINNQMYDFLDIASVEVDEDKRNKGVFTSFLSELLNLYPDKNIYVESILNDKLTSILRKFSFEEQVINELQLNMFLIRDKK